MFEFHFPLGLTFGVLVHSTLGLNNGFSASLGCKKLGI